MLASLCVDAGFRWPDRAARAGWGPDLGGVPRLDDPIAIIASMWNHSAKMEQELRKGGLPWPRLESGLAADLIAFLPSRRDTAADRPTAGASRVP
ncbi:MAG: hypothetical protein HYS05_09290 [Acidobacteria bacterium]|nr:hypothetical protein [Acidobacteriota bacterium]